MSKKLTIMEMQRFARIHKGSCISSDYVNNKSKLKWICSHGHIWLETPSNIMRKNWKIWCPYCRLEYMKKIGKRYKIKMRLRYTITDMQKIAHTKGGLCLSNQFVGVTKKLTWQCSEGHLWKATPHKVLLGRWCPICSQGISERICRKYFEKIFGKIFPKSRPKWLTQNRNIELDGYCKELKLAFEYQGKQHYHYIKHFHKKQNLKHIQYNDNLKRVLCKQNNVTLIEIPFTVPFEEMGKYIIQECKKKGVKLPTTHQKISYKTFNVYTPQRLKEMQEIAKSRGGLCLSRQYINSNSKLKWQCEKGHIWKSIPSSIKYGRWCPICANTKRGRFRGNKNE